MRSIKCSCIIICVCESIYMDSLEEHLLPVDLAA